MEERETPDDRAFDLLVERLDLHGTDDAAELGAAEASLRGHAVQGPAPDRTPQAGPPAQAGWRRPPVRLIAAVLLGAVLLTGAITVIWSAGSRSISGGTMTYRMAIDLIGGRGQRENQRRTAMAFAMQWTVTAIDGLQRLTDDPEAPAELRQLAAAQLALLPPLFESEAVAPAGRDVLQAVAMDTRAAALDPARPPAERREFALRLGAIARVGIVALRDMPTGGGVLEEGRLIHLGSIRSLLQD